MIKPRLATDFNGDGGGGDDTDEVTYLFNSWKDKPRPFSCIATDKHFRSPLSHGAAAERVLRYLTNKPAWLPSVLDDLEYVLKTPDDQAPYSKGSAMLIQNAFKKFAANKSFQDWKSELSISDGRPVLLGLKQTKK